MKTKTRPLLALSTAFTLAISISVTSCKKDKDDSTAPISATVNGTSIDFPTVTATAANGEIGMEGDSKDSSYIIINIPDTATANSTYDVEDLDMYYYDNKTNVIYASFESNTHGSVTVNTHDKSGKKIAGKFDGVIYGWQAPNDSVVIKNGQFNITYK